MSVSVWACVREKANSMINMNVVSDTVAMATPTLGPHHLIHPFLLLPVYFFFTLVLSFLPFLKKRPE